MGKVREHQIIALSTKINVICESNCTGIQNFWASGASRNACTLPPLGKPTVGILRKNMLCKEAVFERTGTDRWPLECAKTSFLKVGMVTFTSWSKISSSKHWHFRNIPLFVVKGLCCHWYHFFVKIWMMFCLLFLQDWNFLTHSRSFGCFTSPSFFLEKKTPTSSSHMKRLDVSRTYREGPHLCA